MGRQVSTYTVKNKGLPLIFLGKFVIIVKFLCLLNYFFAIQMLIAFGIEKSLNLEHFKINFKFKYSIIRVQNGWFLIIESWYSLADIIILIIPFSIHKNTIFQVDFPSTCCRLRSNIISCLIKRTYSIIFVYHKLSMHVTRS